MKNQIEEGFLDKLFGMIAKGKADKVSKQMMKKNPKSLQPSGIYKGMFPQADTQSTF